MLSTSAVVIYLLAMGVPIFLLRHFHAKAVYWHLLAIAVALTLGFVTIPESLKGLTTDLVMGFLFISFMVWGVGGLVLYRHDHPHHYHQELP
jgi:hypothetical protein